MKKLAALMLTILLLASLAPAALASQADTTPEESDTALVTTPTITEEDVSYRLTLAVSYTRNLFFNTYDLCVLVDGVEIGDMSQGEKRIVTLMLPSGDHTVTVAARNREKHVDQVELDLQGSLCISLTCKGKWEGLKITKCQFVTGDEAATMETDALSLDSVKNWVDQTLDDITE